MEVFTTIKEVRNFCKKSKSMGRSIGLIPTMGALHGGHIALVKKCREENDTTILSIFINPLQFNNKSDLLKYPRNTDKDLEILKKHSVNCIFIPDAKEMYPVPDERVFNFGSLDKRMEGHFRPTHFNGVAKIVSRLLQITDADRAYFGEKDYQQLAIIKHLVKNLNFNTKIVPCPTVREKDGLAMSSRNALLTDEQRRNAAVISEVLKEASKKTGLTVQELKERVCRKINDTPGLEVEYFEIADGETLQPAVYREASENGLVGCIAVKAGEVRLIDNMVF